MTTQQVADRFIELEKQNNPHQIVEELYGENIVSLEPAHMVDRGMPVRVEGLEAVKAKGKSFGEQIEEVHSGYCSDPVVVGDFFTVAMGMDVTMKGMGRMKMDEIAVYGVKEGKIVSEQFFY